MRRREKKKSSISVGDLARSKEEPNRVGLVVDEFLMEGSTTAPYAHTTTNRALYVRWIPESPHEKYRYYHERLLEKLEKSEKDLNKT